MNLSKKVGDRIRELLNSMEVAKIVIRDSEDKQLWFADYNKSSRELRDLLGYDVAPIRYINPLTNEEY